MVSNLKAQLLQAKKAVHLAREAAEAAVVVPMSVEWRILKPG